MVSSSSPSVAITQSLDSNGKGERGEVAGSAATFAFVSNDHLHYLLSLLLLAHLLASSSNCTKYSQSSTATRGMRAVR